MIPVNLLPADLQLDAFIAGGYAAFPALAADIDVWVPVKGGVLELAAARERILAHVREMGVTIDEQDGEGSRREQFAAEPSLPRDQFITSTFENYHLTLRIRRVGTVTGLGELPYHIIVVDGDVDEVLGAFDISTHQCALTRRGFVRGEQWTPINAAPVVITEKYTTPERLAKIRYRYEP